MDSRWYSGNSGTLKLVVADPLFRIDHGWAEGRVCCGAPATKTSRGEGEEPYLHLHTTHTAALKEQKNPPCFVFQLGLAWSGNDSHVITPSCSGPEAEETHFYVFANSFKIRRYARGTHQSEY
jgi:hypothetical protein